MYIKFVFILTLLLFTACDQSANKSQSKKIGKRQAKDYNVLEKYVRTPLDQANQTSKKLEDRNRDLENQ